MGRKDKHTMRPLRTLIPLLYIPLPLQRCTQINRICPVIVTRRRKLRRYHRVRALQRGEVELVSVDVDIFAGESRCVCGGDDCERRTEGKEGEESCGRCHRRCRSPHAARSVLVPADMAELGVARRGVVSRVTGGFLESQVSSPRGRVENCGMWNCALLKRKMKNQNSRARSVRRNVK